jgi:hypothetical protein
MPSSPLMAKKVLLGFIVLSLVFVFALWITPEKEDK